MTQINSHTFGDDAYLPAHLHIKINITHCCKDDIIYFMDILVTPYNVFEIFESSFSFFIQNSFETLSEFFVHLTRGTQD